MAGRGGRGVVPAAVHQRPWLVGNENHQKGLEVKKGGASSWEEEMRMLKAKGIAEEELAIYVRKVQSDNPPVNNLNDEIVVKLNAIAGYRRQWFILCIGSGNAQDMKKVKGHIADLKKQVAQLQNQVHNAQGVPEQMPKLFDSMPKV